MQIGQEPRPEVKKNGVDESKSLVVFSEMRALIEEDTCTPENIIGALAREEINKEQYTELITLLAVQEHKKRIFLEKEAQLDTLTGAFNLKGLEEKLPLLVSQLNMEKSLRTEPGISSVMLIAIDIDNFKPFNEIAGHPGGDVALRAVVERLKQVTRKFGGDMVFRQHGDEFSVVLIIKKDLSEEELSKVFENFQDKVNSDLTISLVPLGKETEQNFSVTLAMGYATLKKGDISNPKEVAEKLISDADKDQVKAKAKEAKELRIKTYQKFPIS
jgi:diguanylate cyclase (GGDEF)-like protein